MMLPLVSIITPSLNQVKFIEKTILSVMKQEYPHIEHVIIDGGSTDGTIDVLRKYQDKYNLRWLSEPDNGQAEAINKGLTLAKGNIIGWLNSDDTYMNKTLMKVVEVFNSENNVSWLYGDGYWVDEEGKVLYEYTAKQFDLTELVINGMFFPQPSMFIRSSLLHEVGLLDVNINTVMDYDYCLRLGLRTKGIYINSILATRRLHNDAKSASSIEKFYEDTLYVLENFYCLSELSNDILSIRKKAFSKAHLVGGYNLFLQGDKKKARKLLYKSIKLNPDIFSKNFISASILILESLLNMNYLSPGHSRNKAIIKYAKEIGETNTNWWESTQEIA